MSTVRSSIASGCLALLVGACGSGTGNSGGTGGTVGGGGTSGVQNSGGTGNPNGGSTGNSGGGSTGTPNGGAAANTGGAAGSKATGGAAGTTAAAGGSAGGNSAPSTGGSQAGGTQGAGGTTTSPGTGGTPVPSTALVTSANGAYWKTGTWTEATSGNAAVTVNDSSVAQTWEGMGGAFNELGWTYLTTKEMKDQAIQMLFGSDGCRFAWGRIPIGASDYATERYTLDDTGTDVVPDGTESNRPPEDTSLSKFSIERDKQNLIPYIQAAQAVKSDIRFWASPWTPPSWMKTGHKTDNTSGGNAKKASYFDGGAMKSDEAILKAHAQYFVKFVQAYADQGIKVEYVAPQNEPNYEQNYPSCHWDTSLFVSFVGKYLGPALAEATPDTKIMLGTLSNPGGDAAIGSGVLADATAKGYCKVVGVQWGMADQSQVKNLKDKGLSLWVSEHQCGGNAGANVAAAPNDFSYAQASWNNIKTAIGNGLTAYNAWNMVLDKGGKGIDTSRVWAQNALLVADSGQVTATPAYYVFRHVSQFVEPGATVVGTSGGEAVAFKNPDGSIVAVLYNNGGTNNNYIVSIAGKKLQFAMPGSAWATVKYKP